MTHETDEQDLLTRLRSGQDEAFGELFERHAPAVRRLACSLANDPAEADDITAETFFRVLRAIKRGNGPHDNIRGYLLTVARRVAWEWRGASHDVPVSDDELTSRAGATESACARSAEYALITRAFVSLPERWRTVLWRTEVEGAQPAKVAPHFGLTPNATAALARRARQGLRAAYLQAHLSTYQGNASCRSVLDKLGSYTAGAVTPAEAARIAAHLGNCAACRSTHAELRDVCHSLRAHAGVIALALPSLAGAGALAAGSAESGTAVATGTTATSGTTVATEATATSGTTASGTAAVASKLTALKSVFASAKLKVGAAVASTAVVGVLGWSAGAMLNGEAVNVLGLHGQQGYDRHDPTVERGHGEGTSSSSGQLLKRSPAKTIDTQRQEQDSDTQRLDSVKPNRSDSGTADHLSGTVLAEVPPTTPSSPDTVPDLPSPKAKNTTVVEGARERHLPGSPPDSQPEETVNRPALAPEEPPQSSYEDVAHDCVDDFEYYEFYNDVAHRTEMYEYSYMRGVGYERTTYIYDDGQEYSSTYYWHDDC